LKLNIIKGLIACSLILVSFTTARANDSNDSVTLIQSYVNLSLTKTYFDTLSPRRIAKILPFIEGEMAKIQDKNFIQENRTLYNITWSYLFYLKSRFLYQNKKDINRTVLLKWKNTLNQAIDFINAADIYSDEINWDNTFYDFGEFKKESCISLFTSIIDLKSQFSPYFSSDVATDLHRVFFNHGKLSKFNYDSLSYYSGLYNIPYGYNGDSLILIKAYINLSTTGAYFDSLSQERVSEILLSAEKELARIKDTSFLKKNITVYNFTYSNLYYLKSRLLFTYKTEVSRPVLLSWKETLYKSKVFFANARIPWSEIDQRVNPYFEPVRYDRQTCEFLSGSIEKYNSEFNPYFTKDIYPDFQRLFYTAKNRNEFYFDSLEYFTSLYAIPINFRIIENLEKNPYAQLKSVEYFLSNGYEYKLPLALDLISRYLQLSFIANKESTVKYVLELQKDYSEFIRALNPDDSLNFSWDSEIPKDDFFRRELDIKTCNELLRKLEAKYPHEVGSGHGTDSDGDGVADEDFDLEVKLYFPIPVPFPSSKISINHFRPELKTLKQTDDYIKKCFNEAGYKGRLHYFYIREPGYAVTTGIEKINKNGSPVKPDERWNLTISDNGSISLYQIFKSIFFTTENDYRMICCVVASHEVASGKKSFSMKDMNNLLKNSYSSLPTDLENVVLTDKTLTILVYHFYQSDVGEVPLLDTKQKVTAQQHLLNTSSLARLIN
jgi:hypothetical protein